MTPAVTLTERDGAIGVLPNGQKIVAMIGCSDAGALNVPAAYSRRQDLVSALVGGPLLEFAAYHVTSTRQPILVCPSDASTAGTESAIDVSGKTGTSAVSLGGYDTSPNDDYEIVVLVTKGGTVGTGPIQYKLSYDGGRNYEPVRDLGTAHTLFVPNAGGIDIDFTTGTLVTGDVVSFRTYAPKSNGAAIVAALEALRVSAQAWDVVICSTPLDASAFSAVALQMASMPEKCFLGCFAMPALGVSDTTHLAAFVAAFGTLADDYIAVSYGAAKSVSAISGRQYRRPVLYSAGPRLATLSEEQDAAWVDLGALPGVQIRDRNGNLDEHDEAATPGADDARAITLRMFDGGPQGVYITNPNLFSPAGSDFQFVQHRRVMNLAKVTLRAYFTHRLSKSVLVNATTGFILESEALEIEAGARAAMRATLRAKPKCSAIDFTLSRTDNLLSTKTMTGTASVTPLAYPKAIEIDVGFRNPALQTVSVP